MEIEVACDVSLAVVNQPKYVQLMRSQILHTSFRAAAGRV
jgi:hypothetical protein